MKKFNFNPKQSLISLALGAGLVIAGLVPVQAQNNQSLFEGQPQGLMEPENIDVINRVFPQIMKHGYAGKVIVRFDIDDAGVPQNFEILEATRDVIYDGAARKLVKKFRFPAGAPKTGFVYPITFCLMGDRITPVLCDIQFERVAGPAEPRVLVYSIPYYNSYAVKKKICGNVLVRFDVDKAGLIQHTRIISSTRPGQFEISLKRSLARFEFERGKPAKGIEYKIGFGLPGRCQAPK